MVLRISWYLKSFWDRFLGVPIPLSKVYILEKLCILRKKSLIEHTLYVLKRDIINQKKIVWNAISKYASMCMCECVCEVLSATYFSFKLPTLHKLIFQLQLFQLQTNTYIIQGSKGIRQLQINWCISPMMIFKITPF